MDLFDYAGSTLGGSRTNQAAVTLIILAPDCPKPLLSLITFLKDADIKNVHDTCKTSMLSHFEQTEVLNIETTVKDRVASEIWDLYQQHLK